jgi:hypothetical protein
MVITKGLKNATGVPSAYSGFKKIFEFFSFVSSHVLVVAIFR